VARPRAHSPSGLGPCYGVGVSAPSPPLVPTSYEHPRPALTVDCVVLGVDDALRVLLIERALPPFEGAWALPGGFVRVGESVEAAARRELAEETGLHRVYLDQLHVFGDPGRDPREHVVTVAFSALVKLREHAVRAATDARRAAWFEAAHLPPLAFDHADIVALALSRLRARVRYEPIGFELLPPEFTLTELQRLYELVLGRPLDKRNFRKKVLASGLVVPTGAMQQGVSHRAAAFHRFDRPTYERLVREGYAFEW
jgi:8-oxo-dGTP diphosphatase